MSDAVELDKCRAELHRAETWLANARHRIADLDQKLAAAEEDAARYRWLESHQEGWSWRPSRYNETIVSGFSANGTGYLGFGFTAAIDAARGEDDA